MPEIPPLADDVRADVAAMGAGHTGLSAAYHLKMLRPDEEAVVLEAEFAGHGASGRNGGMCLMARDTASIEAPLSLHISAVT